MQQSPNDTVAMRDLRGITTADYIARGFEGWALAPMPSVFVNRIWDDKPSDVSGAVVTPLSRYVDAGSVGVSTVAEQ